MRSSLLYLAEVWLACTLIGIAVIAPMRKSFRNLWLPATPVLGAAFLVVSLHWTSIWHGTDVGIRWAVLAAALIFAFGAARGQKPWLFESRAVLAAALTSVIGLAGAVLALVPNAIIGSSRVVLATPNHDAFYYISESVWLSDSSVLHAPVVATAPGSGTESPLGTSAAQAALLPLRVGQALTSSGIHALFGIDDLHGFMPTMAAWVMFTAGAVFVAMRLLGANSVAGLVAAGLVCTGATLTQAAYSQHADSLLGIAMVTLTLAAYLTAVFRRLPRWPAILLTTGLIGCYTEYAVFLVPTVAAATLMSPGHGYRRRIRRSAEIFGLALVISPLVWVRGLKNLLVSQSGGDAFPSPYLTPEPLLGVGRALGLAGPTAGTSRSVVILLVGLSLLVGCVLTVVLSRLRVGLSALLAVCAVVCAYATVTGRGYLQDRLVTLSMPFVLVLATLGWSLAVRRLAADRVAWRRIAAVVAAVAMTVGAAATASAAGRTSVASLDPAFVRSRAVTAEFDEVAGWVREVGGDEGEHVTVAVPDLFDQMWLLYALRDETLVSFVSLHPDYLRPEQYWKGEVDHYVIVGDGAVLAGSEAAVLRRTEHFRLIDTTKVPVAVVAPTQMSTWGPFPDAGGGAGGAGSGLVVLKGSKAPKTVDATLTSTLQSLPVVVVRADGSSQSVTLGPAGRMVQVTDTPAPTGTATLTITDPRAASQSIRLVGATFPRR